MIPSTFTWLTDLTVTANDNVDRADLAASAGSMVTQLLEVD